MRAIVFHTICVLAALIISCPASEEWIQLFNGKDLDGWTIKINGHEVGDNVGNTFRVEDGLLKVRYDQYENFDEKFGHIFYRQSFSNYVIRVEYRFVGDQLAGGPKWAYRNSGIMFHAQSPESMDLVQFFPVSIEAQMLGGNGKKKRPTANACTPGTHLEKGGKLVTAHCTSSSSKTFHGDQWVTMELEVHGGERITHKVNGEEVLSYEHPQLDPSDETAQKLITSDDLVLGGGYIALQAESHPLDIRRVELRVLDDGETP